MYSARRMAGSGLNWRDVSDHDREPCLERGVSCVKLPNLQGLGLWAVEKIDNWMNKMTILTL